MLTRQEIFNIVWKAFVLDKALPSYDDKKECCLLRGPNRTKCAIGFCIPDDQYLEESNQIDIFNLLDENKYSNLFAPIYFRDLMCP